MASYLTLTELFKALESVPGRKVRLSRSQQEIISRGDGPLWVIAGPGSGKTEILVLRCLKLMLVDGVDPKSVFITSFTEKASRNLRDRLTNYKLHVAKSHPSVGNVDLFNLRVGTLHSLCNEIMLEERYPGYKNFRPLDDLEQLWFIYFHSVLASPPSRGPDWLLEFWTRLSYVLTDRGRWAIDNGQLPSMWTRARAAQDLFNRVVEDGVDVEKMEARGGEWAHLAEAYRQYSAALDRNYRVDFAHMQSKFLEFLATPLGKHFIEGDGLTSPGITNVLVDEYQDTNPVQEAIYLKLALKAPHNLAVVGDDDQALYRFRGGTVDCMVNFDKAVKAEWGLVVKPTPLVENYRSHPGIVAWCNAYIQSFPAMKKKGARVADKPPLESKSDISGTYPPVVLLTAKKHAELAQEFADTVSHLLKAGVISKPSQCALLMRSTRESSRWAGPFCDAVRNLGIPIYNPRSRQYLKQDEIKAALGALFEILDPEPDYKGMYVPREAVDACEDWRTTFRGMSKVHKDVQQYVEEAKKVIGTGKSGDYINNSLQEILYHILNLEPFASWLEDPERTYRLGQLTHLVEAFASSPIPKHPGVSRGSLKISSQADGELSWQWKMTLYHSFVTLLCEEGLSDPEDEDILYPPDRVPVMTVHQAKGLEFPFVFISRMDEDFGTEAQHRLEEEFSLFRYRVYPLMPAIERAKQDLIRFYFVAYSRAQYALVMMVPKKKLLPGEVEGRYLSLGGKDLPWLLKQVKLEAA